MFQKRRSAGKGLASSGLMLATVMAGMLGVDDDATASAQSDGDPKNAARIARRVLFCHCLRCGNEWMPRVENPAQCPACKSALWNIAREERRQQKKYAPRGKPFAKGDDPRRIHDRQSANADASGNANGNNKSQQSSTNHST